MISEKPDQQQVEEDVFVFPASFAQQRLWFIEQLLPGDSLYVIPIVLRLTGVPQRSHLQRSIQAIIQRHESLKTTFEVVEGQLVQVVVSHSEGAIASALQLTDLQTLPLSSCEDTAMAQIWEEIQQPFRLDRGPLFRVRLWQLQETEHLLLMAFHHIIFDEWSSGVLIRELGERYTAFVEDKPVKSLELPIQYTDFANWQRHWLQGEVLEKHSPIGANNYTIYQY